MTNYTDTSPVADPVIKTDALYAMQGPGIMTVLLIRYTLVGLS